MQLFTFAERPDLEARLGEIPEGWPEFIHHDAVVERYWPRLREELPELQLVLRDEEQDAVVGEARTIPFRWDGRSRGCRRASTTSSVRGFGSASSPHRCARR